MKKLREEYEYIHQRVEFNDWVDVTYHGEPLTAQVIVRAKAEVYADAYNDDYYGRMLTYDDFDIYVDDIAIVLFDREMAGEADDDELFRNPVAVISFSGDKNFIDRYFKHYKSADRKTYMNPIYKGDELPPKYVLETDEGFEFSGWLEDALKDLASEKDWESE